MLLREGNFRGCCLKKKSTLLVRWPAARASPSWPGRQTAAGRSPAASAPSSMEVETLKSEVTHSHKGHKVSPPPPPPLFGSALLCQQWLCSSLGHFHAPAERLGRRRRESDLNSSSQPGEIQSNRHLLPPASDCNCVSRTSRFPHEMRFFRRIHTEVSSQKCQGKTFSAFTRQRSRTGVT